MGWEKRIKAKRSLKGLAELGLLLAKRHHKWTLEERKAFDEHWKDLDRKLKSRKGDSK